MSYLSLKIFKQGQLLKTKIFTDDQISIGSSEGLSLQLEGISPWHALIEKKHDIFCVLDLHSETGTWLAGQKITEESPISSGAMIGIGPYEIQFFIGPPVEKSPPPVSEKKPLEEKAIPPEKPVPSPPDLQKTEKPAQALKEEIPKTPTVEEKPPLSAEKAQAKAPFFDSSQAFPPKERPTKPSGKGFWNSYAPQSAISNLDEFITPSIGNLIEVTVCWKERILSSHHFFKSGDIFMGLKKTCQVKFPNMISSAPYKLLSIASGAKIYLSQGVRGLLIQGKNKSTRTFHELKGNQTVILKPYEMVKLEFNSFLKVYVRLMDKSAKPPLAGLLNLRLSEAMALFLAFLLTGFLVFYGGLYAPAFLKKDTEFIEKDVRVAKVVFKKAPQPKVVKYDLAEKTKKASSIQKKKPKVTKKKAQIKTVKRPKKKRNPKKPIATPRKGKQGKMAAQAPGKNPKKKKVTVGSVRPGGSLKTGKKGSSAKTVAPDPSKVGLLGTFGGGGKLAKLDKGASGSGGLLGLAEQSTGYAGTKESYGGEGIGTKTKDLGSGGRGSSLVGISGIKTKGKGLGRVGSGVGGLGKRGRMNIEFGSEDIDVTGEIDREAIRQVLFRNRIKFDRCYNMSLNQKSTQGTMTMQWLISSSGRGRSAKAINNKLGSKSLANCVSGVLERLNFPQPPAGQLPKVTFTFNFAL